MVIKKGLSSIVITMAFVTRRAYIFCGHHLLVAKLRSSNVDPAAGAKEEIQRLIGLIRQQWKDTHILVRGDSAYARA